MFTRLHNRAGHHLVLIALGLVLFFPNLGGPSLWDLDEGRNATCALEMLLANTWVIPTFNGQLRPDKPALLYWLQMAAYDVFGVNEFAGRLPSALAALATVLLCYELARSMFTPSTGLLAGIVAAASPMLCGAARFANPDALLNLLIVLTLALFWIGWQRPRLWWFVAIGAAEGCGMLAKGAVALVLPLAIITAFLLWQRRPWLLLDRRNIAGGVALLLVAAPWYVRVTVETKGAFARDFFLTHHVDRFTSRMENHGGGLWYYPLVIVLGTVPWAIFLGPAFWYGFWSALRTPAERWRIWWSAAAESAAAPTDADRRIAAYRLLACWIGLFLVFFTISATKLPNYALPALVPTAIVMARFLDRWRLGELHLARWVLPASLGCLVLTGVGLAVGARGVMALESQKSARALVADVGALQRDRDIRVVAWQLDHLPSLNFYVQRNVEVCKTASEVCTYLRYPLPVFVFLPVSEWEQLKDAVDVPWRELARRPDLYKHEDVVVITNR